jgi:hypothetical protein
MKNINENISLMKNESVNKDLILNNFKIGKINMKTRIILSSLITVIFLVAFSSCNITKNTEAQTGFAGRVILPADSNYSDYTEETILNGNANYNSQGKTVSYTEETTDGTTTDGILENSSNYEDEEILNDNPNTEDANLDTFENSLSADGSFISVTQDEIDPVNNVSDETVNVDEDIYTNTIWVPNSNYVSAGWNPYTNGRWVWSRYGWTWASNYSWGRHTYHYGRWWYSSRYGWVWSPGRKWAPAWVIWGHHKKYEGWYPISPRVHIQKKGVISPVMPRFKNNGWVIVKNSDFTKDVNSSTIISNTKTNDIIKNSTKSVTLKQDGNTLFNEGNVKKNDIIQTKNNNQKSIEQVVTKQKPNDNNSVKTPVSDSRQNNTKVKNNTTVITTPNDNLKESQKKVTDNKKNISISSTPNTKQNNTVTNTKSSNTENKTVVKDNQKKTNVTESSTPNTKQNNTVTNTKSNSTESKTTVNDNQKKTVETQPISVEKNRNNNTNNNTKTAPKVEQTPKVIQSPKVEQTPKVIQSPKVEQAPKVKQTPKVEQSPKVNKEPVNNTQQKTITKKEGN